MKRAIPVFLLVALLVLGAAAQDKSKDDTQKPTALAAEFPPLRVCGPKNPSTHCAKTPPKLTHGPDPSYSKEARKKHYEGTVVLWIVIGSDGRVHDLKVARPVGMGLDEKAIEAVKKWRFDPARDENDRPVAVQVNVEVNFRMSD